MADLAATSGSALFSPQILQLLQGLVGGEEDVSQQIAKALQQNVTGTQTSDQATTGTQNQTTNQSQNQQQSTSGTSTTTGNTTGAVTGNTTGTTNQTTQGIADVTQLQKVFEQQQAGITPEMLQAIFTEGSKAAPGLVSATANAVGARSSANTPLATALTELNSRLVNQAAALDLQQKNASAGTAAQIAQLTSGQQVTGTTSQNQQQTTSQQQEQSTATQQLTDLVSNLVSTLTGNTTQNTTGTQTNNQATTSTEDSTLNQSKDTSLDTGNISKMLGGLLLGSGINQGLEGLGGITGAIGSATGGLGKGIAEILKQLGIGAPTGGSVAGQGDQAIWDEILGSGSLFGNSSGVNWDEILNSIDPLTLTGDSPLTTVTGGEALPSWFTEEGWDSWDLWGTGD